MAISINHKGHKGGERPETATVSAGCTVRFRLRLTDGGVALDWTDPRVSFRDVCIWSGPRMGVIAHPAFSFDADDPTLLVVEHTTSTKDLPGLHSLVIDVSFMGWSAVHAVPAYVLKSPLYGDGGGADCGDAGTHDLTVALHDVSTTYLQRLIDAMLKLRLGENARLTALEILTETLRNDVDDLSGRMETAEGNIERNADAIKANEEAIETNSKAIETNSKAIAANADAIDALKERMGKAETSIGTLTEGMTTLTRTVQRLVECCKSVNTTLADLEERVTKLEEGGTADPDPEPDPEPEPEYATLTITPDPSDATVVINGEERTEYTAEVGTEIEWSVSKEGYLTQSGTLTLEGNRTLEITLVYEDAVYSDIEITEFSYGDIPASGGTATPTLKYRQTWGYGSQTGGGVIEDGAEVTYGGVEEDGSHTEGSLGTTVRERTQVATASVTVTLNGRTATASAEVWQAENKVETYSGLAWVFWEGEQDITFTATNHIVSLSGYEAVQWRNYSSGGRDSFYVVPNGHMTYTDVDECDWARATSVGFNIDENTSTEMRGPHDVVEACESEGETVSRTYHIYQEGVVEVERTIKFIVSPSDATLTVNGAALEADEEGTYSVTAKDGDVIEWSCECEGYVSQSGTHTVDGDDTITITLEEETAHYITVSPSELELEARDATIDDNVTVSSDGSWTAEAGESWLTLSQTSGGAGETAIHVGAARNTSTSARGTTVTFTSEHGETATLHVTQAASSSSGGIEPGPTGTLTFDFSGTISSGTAFTVTPEMSDGSSQVLTVGLNSQFDTAFGDGESMTLELGGNSFVFNGQTIGSFSKTVESGVSLDGLFTYVAGGQPYNDRTNMRFVFTYADETYDVSVYCRETSAYGGTDAAAHSDDGGNG